MPPLRLSNAVRSLLRLLGVAATEEGLANALNPFLSDLPDPVVVTPTPSPGPGEPATYQMTADKPHVEIVTDADAIIFVSLPELSGCANGTKFSLKLTQGEGGADYAVLTGYGQSLVIVTGIRYQFVVANGNNLSMLNDWVLWGSSFARIAGVLGEKGDTPEDESIWGEIGTREEESDPDGSVWATIKDLQERIAALEPGE